MIQFTALKLNQVLTIKSDIEKTTGISNGFLRLESNLLNRQKRIKITRQKSPKVYKGQVLILSHLQNQIY